VTDDNERTTDDTGPTSDAEPVTSPGDDRETPADDDSLAGRIGAVAEAALFAPLGFALEARTLLPRLTERGRNHVAMAKVMGEFAVRKGSEDLAAGALSGQERLLHMVRSRLGGLVGGAATGGANAGNQGEYPGGATTASPQAAPRVSVEAAEAAAGIDPDSLGIPGYDLLSASQVVPRLEGLSPDELELVARYEAGTRGRKTILAKVAQLRTDGPSGA
jgi:hypothetical protein